MKEFMKAAYKDGRYKRRPPRPRYTDPRSTAELIALALAAGDEVAQWQYVRVLRDRVSPEIMDTVRGLCLAGSVGERILGADLLAEIASADASWQDEAAAILLTLLEQEHNPQVLFAVAEALGNLRDPYALARLIELRDHPDGEVRKGVVQGLLERAEDSAVAALIDLSNDTESEVRDWATFGLGTMIELDTAAIRAALYARVDDHDDDTRGEAVCGLARRGDPRVVAPLLAELATRELADISPRLIEAAVEAALRLRDRRLYPALVRLQAVAPSYEEDDLEAALKGCWNKQA